MNIRILLTAALRVSEKSTLMFIIIKFFMDTLYAYLPKYSINKENPQNPVIQ